MRLTIDISQEPDTPNQWTSHCIEIDVISAGLSPEHALEALAEAIRLTVQYEAKRRGLSSVETFSAISAEHDDPDKCLDCGTPLVPCTCFVCCPGSECPACRDRDLRSDGSLTRNEMVAAARNVGVDLRCGRCASVFYTGGSEHRHDATCETGVLDFAPMGNVAGKMDRGDPTRP